MVYKVRKKSVSPKTQAPPFSNTLFLAPARLAPKSCVIYPCNKKTNQFVVNQLVSFYRVIPWGVEPQSKEPESFILSIKLWDQKISRLRWRKIKHYLLTLQK